MERVVRKRQQWSDNRNQWKNCRGYPHEREERDCPAPFLALYDLEFSAPFSVGNPDRDHCDQTYQELHSAKPGIHDVSANRVHCGVRHARIAAAAFAGGLSAIFSLALLAITSFGTGLSVRDYTSLIGASLAVAAWVSVVDGHGFGHLP
jgi:hypothetical protein